MSPPADPGRRTESTVWYLELSERRGPPPEPPADHRLEIVRAELPSPEFSRFLYAAVGGDHLWIDRLRWTRQDWEERLNQPGLENWVAWIRGTPVGYAELRAEPDGNVEIGSFGLMPAFRGRGLSRYLLAFALEKAWTIAERWPGFPPARRVWLHTCSFDSPAALHVYRCQGLTVYKVETTEVELPQDRELPS